MELRESERVEFKREFTRGISKTIVAFANGTGGAIYIGIDDFGTVVGVDDLDEVMLQISSLVRDAICPELLQFVRIDAIELEGAQVVRVEVERGDRRPYYLASKGLVPAGVYTRLGPASVPMDRASIRRIIREVDRDHFETRHAAMQELTFNEAALAFERRGMPFEEGDFKTLGLYAEDGFYSNLALLISDQNPSTIRCAMFNDDAFTEFISSRELTGSVFRQYDDATTFLEDANKRRSYFPGPYRVDVWDYPPAAVREGLINSIVHRDYDRESPTLIKMNRTRLDFISFGGLHGITMEEAREGCSSTRNPKLQSMFHRLGIVEAYGTGLPGIFSLYEREGLEPRIRAENAFQLSLPNINTSRNPDLSLTSNDGPSLRGGEQELEELHDRGAMPHDVAVEYERVQAQRREALQLQDRAQRDVERQQAKDESRFAVEMKQLTAREDSGPGKKDESTGTAKLERYLMEFALGREEFSRQEAEQALMTNRDTTLKVINDLIDKGKLERTGQARATRYRLVG